MGVCEPYDHLSVMNTALLILTIMIHYERMNICAEDEAGHRVHLLALQAYPVGWNYRIRGTVIPLAASVYPNERAVQTDTFVCAVVQLEWEKP